MTTSYDAAVETLYRGPLDGFVVDRKRLASELKAEGDAAGAARLAKLGRPSMSAWAVNQLWWHERAAFDRLIAAAARLKKGERDAGDAHRQALTSLRALAAARLVGGGHAAAESTLRRVTMTLSALAATGGFEPDPPGALVADRDPPGFEALGFGGQEPVGAAEAHVEPRREHDDTAAKRREQAELERKRAAAERQRLEEERARKHAERQRLKTALSVAQTEAVAAHREVERLRYELVGAEAKLEKAQGAVTKLKEALAALD